MKFEVLAKLLLINKLKKQLDRLDKEQSSQANSNDVSIEQVYNKIAILDNELKNLDKVSSEKLNEVKDLANKFAKEDKERADKLIDHADKTVSTKYQELREDLISQLEKLIKIPKDGKDGKDGSRITDARIDKGELIIAIDGLEQNLGKIVIKGDRGDQGEPGQDAVSIKSVQLIDYQLVIRLTDDTVYELGNVRGEKGEKGEMPDHEWRQTSLRFEKPDGTWGKWVNLKGDKGSTGGGIGPVASGSSSRLTTKNNNVLLTNDTRSINFAGDIQAVKTSSNSIDVSVSSTAGQLPWNIITQDQVAENTNGYITNSTNRINLTLPITGQVGDIIKVMGLGLGGFRIVQNPGDVIYFGNRDTTVGPSGYIDSIQNRNTLELIRVSDKIYMIATAVGNFIIN